MKHMFGKKVHLGRFAVPVWTIGLAGLLVAAVAGQAVGPVLSGSVQGSAGLVVSQTVVLKQAPTVVGDDGAATMNDEGTAFTVAIETQVGQTSDFRLALVNDSGAPANFILELNAPAGIDVDAEDSNPEVKLAQLSKNVYLGTLAVSNNATDDIIVTVESKDDAAPGFYTITGRIIQVAN
ncbi:MAG: hypothetical protein HYY01_00810 [Chloroflexi bacterium]|nr:hypothetical protein [Chloroflexota bacterium]